MNRRRLLAVAPVALLVAASAVFHACGSSRPPGKPVVACTTPVLADFVRAVGGDHVDVRSLVAPLESPHKLDSTPELVKAVEDSWAIFENGAGLEPWLDGLVKQAKGDHPRHVATKGVALLSYPNGDPDPHAWLDPRRAATYVENARNLLISLDPDHETDFRTNADAFLESLKAVDARMTSGVESIAPERRKILTVHDSMRYFAARYGFETKALAPPGVAPSEMDQSDASEWLAKNRIPSMFAEAGLDENPIRSLSFKNQRMVKGPLWTETLDSPGKPQGSYRGAMEYNLDELTRGLR